MSSLGLVLPLPSWPSSLPSFGEGRDEGTGIGPAGDILFVPELCWFGGWKTNVERALLGTWVCVSVWTIGAVHARDVPLPCKVENLRLSLWASTIC